jgi:hypothetical protein
MKAILRHPAFPEAYIWLAGIILLTLTNPYIQEWTLCPLHNLGFEYCPGCGLGRSVSLILRGDFIASWQMHPLGGLALVVLITRSIYLLFYYPKNRNYGKSNRIIS